MSQVPTITLNNGVEMPLLGFGVFQIPDAEECERSVAEALRAGYRLIDTAAAYFNEEAVGRAIASSGIPREDIFLVTKLWHSSAGDGQTREAYQRALDRLQTDYVDLYLIHQPLGDVYGAWRDMQVLLAEGRVRAIGVSNFGPDRIADFIAHTDIVPAVNQIELHPFTQQIETQAYHDSLGIATMAWGPLAEGKEGIFENEVLSTIAASYGRTIAQVVVRWLIQRQVIAIPKSVRPERIAENFDVLDFELTADDMAAIAALDYGRALIANHHDPEFITRISSFNTVI